uniref:Uncharacterized protein n=1 Tax=Stomoxys calcitrans TaxID=35570 RepID=A0A1I8NRU8_STOCA
MARKKSQIVIFCLLLGIVTILALPQPHVNKGASHRVNGTYNSYSSRNSLPDYRPKNVTNQWNQPLYQPYNRTHVSNQFAPQPSFNNSYGVGNQIHPVPNTYNFSRPLNQWNTDTPQQPITLPRFPTNVTYGVGNPIYAVPSYNFSKAQNYWNGTHYTNGTYMANNYHVSAYKSASGYNEPQQQPWNNVNQNRNGSWNKAGPQHGNAAGNGGYVQVPGPSGNNRFVLRNTSPPYRSRPLQNNQWSNQNRTSYYPAQPGGQATQQYPTNPSHIYPPLPNQGYPKPVQPNGPPTKGFPATTPTPNLYPQLATPRPYPAPQPPVPVHPASPQMPVQPHLPSQPTVLPQTPVQPQKPNTGSSGTPTVPLYGSTNWQTAGPAALSYAQTGPHQQPSGNSNIGQAKPKGGTTSPYANIVN